MERKRDAEATATGARPGQHSTLMTWSHHGDWGHRTQSHAVGIVTTMGDEQHEPIGAAGVPRTSQRRLYTADRGRMLRTGMTLVPASPPVDLGAAQARFGSLYPNGLSPHGLRYVAADIDHERNATLEAVFEMVRREQFAGRPSRFDCIFGCGTVTEAWSFASEFAVPGVEPIVWELAATSSFAADMRLLRGHSLLQMQINAERYWSQDHSDDPLIEHLVPLPATVVREARR